MFGKFFALFAMLAVAFAAPSPYPKAEPQPQYLTYGAVPAAYPAVVSPYAAPVAISAYSAYPGAYYVR